MLGVDTPPNKVQEIKTDALQQLQIVHRDDGMMMYAPAPDARDKKAVWEIVIHRPYSDGLHTAFRYVVTLCVHVSTTVFVYLYTRSLG